VMVSRWRSRAPALNQLPSPPDDEQKFSYAKRYIWLVCFCAVASFACVAYSTTRFSLVSDELWGFVGLIGFAAIGLMISMQAHVFSRDFDDAEHRRFMCSWPPGGEYPAVDVFLPICGERTEVLRNTWEHVRDLDYPDVTVYVLDDGASDIAQGLAKRMGFRYLRRENRGWFKKAGNLRFGYEHSTGEFVLVLDADFCPRPDFLRETLPYFDTDPTLGIVQTPQFFATHHDQNWLERGACAVQELFYRVAQVSRESRNASICVGTCAVYRRAALDSNGGTTLVEHSEDVHTGFDLRANGWGLRYVPVNLAAGLCPDDVSSFFRQQYRWCMGSMSLCRSGKFWRTRMPLRTRLCYMSGFFYYISTALMVLAGPLMPLTLTLFFPWRIELENYVILLPALLWMYVGIRLWHRSDFRLEVLSVKLLYGWANAFALLDIVRGRPMGWTPTGAKAKNDRVLWFRVSSTVWGGATSVLLLGACVWRVLVNRFSAVQFLPMFLFAGVYLLTNLRVIFPNLSLRTLLVRTERIVLTETDGLIHSVGSSLRSEEDGIAAAEVGRGS
jgi:cellulose synthase (UDP-forming)